MHTMSHRCGLLVAALLSVSACSNESKDSLADSMLVFESKQAVQCESRGIPLAESANRLVEAGIDVLESHCGQETGVAYTTVCGGGTTAINLHRINAVNLATANALGFASVDELIDTDRGTGFEIVDCGELE